MKFCPAPNCIWLLVASGRRGITEPTNTPSVSPSSCDQMNSEQEPRQGLMPDQTQQDDNSQNCPTSEPGVSPSSCDQMNSEQEPRQGLMPDQTQQDDNSQNCPTSEPGVSPSSCDQMNSEY